MNIIVCIKVVPDTETDIKIAPDGKTILTDNIKWVMNPYDEYGVEEALCIKEKFGGEITVITIGSKIVTEAVRTALAMGADRGIIINDAAVNGSDSIASAKLLAAAIKPLEFDLIFTGQRGIDEDMGVVGPALAELLNIPHHSLAVKVEINEKEKTVRVNKPVEGETLVVESSLPALITAQKGLNEPRYPKLPAIMKASKKPLEEKTLSDLGLTPSDFGKDARKLKIIELVPPPERKEGIIIEGDTPQEKAAELARILHEEAKIF